MKKAKNVVRFWGIVVNIVLILCIIIPIVNAAETEDTSEHELMHYYYNELNDIEKAIYEKLADSKEELIEGNEITLEIHPYSKDKKLGYIYYYKTVKRAIKAYTYDNPETEIWLDNYERTYYKTENYVYMVLSPIEKTSDSVNWEENTKDAVSELENIANEFVKTLHGTDKEKLKQIHDWLAVKAVYDNTLELPNTRTAYGTMVNKKSVCSGFAYAYKYIANLAGLDVVYVTGKAYNAQTDLFEPHAWNVVCIKGEYFLVDVTFDIARNGKIGNTFLFSPIDDGIHYPETYYFKYPF